MEWGRVIKDLDMNELANRIRSRRAYLRISQSELAERVGMARTSIWGLESAKQNISLPGAWRIAQALELSGLDEMIGKDHE